MNLKEPGEWEDFIITIWPFQWLRKSIPLTQGLSDLMYHYSQGIIDIAIKLFTSVQWECILNESETITAQVIDIVWKRDFKLLHKMMDAYRTGDIDALDQYKDLAPLSSESLLDKALRRYEGVRSQKGALRPGHPNFAPTITETLTTMGIDAALAAEIAASVEADGKTKNLLDGTQAAIEKVKPPKTTNETKKGGSKEVKSTANDLAPDDYRNAIARAAENKTKIFDELDAMGHVCDLDALFDLN
jgi:hypothetical protein